jgi:hypothetical protein
MRYQKTIQASICFILTINFFYDGMYYLVNHHVYQLWLGNLPYLKGPNKVLSILIPLCEIFAALSLFVSKWRRGTLISIIVALMVFELYLMLTLTFNSRLYLPLHAFWGHTVWLYKMIYSIALAWLALLAVKLMPKGYNTKNKSDENSKHLRNTSVSVH